jgi:assimilatory nitrate reductase catalytic subunit
VNSQPRFLQGAFSFEGRGLTEPVALDGGLAYTVPSDRRAQLVYFRGGNSSAELIYALLARDGEPMRYFPIGARAACHVPLRVVEDLAPDTELAVLLAAPEQVTGTLVVDIGIIES